MNADEERDKEATPPRGRTAYEMAIQYARSTRGHYNTANQIREEFVARAEQGEFGHSALLAQIAASESYQWRVAVEDQRFTERLANLYSNIAIMDFLMLIRQELQWANKLLTEISKK